MNQRLSTMERRAQLLQCLTDCFKQAQTQADFTAVSVAKRAEVSTVLLYRLVGQEFKSLRAQLPGSHRPRDEQMAHLQRENVDLRRQVQTLRKQEREVTVDGLKMAILLQERLEQENLELRGQVRLLKKRLEERGEIIHLDPTMFKR